jgi:hypothetical protein
MVMTAFLARELLNLPPQALSRISSDLLSNFQEAVEIMGLQ